MIDEEVESSNENDQNMFKVKKIYEFYSQNQIPMNPSFRKVVQRITHQNRSNLIEEGFENYPQTRLTKTTMSPINDIVPKNPSFRELS